MSKASRRRSPGSRDERRATIAAKRVCFHGITIGERCAKCREMFGADDRYLVYDSNDVLEPPADAS